MHFGVGFGLVWFDWVGLGWVGLGWVGLVDEMCGLPVGEGER